MSHEEYAKLAAWLSREEGAQPPAVIGEKERVEAEKAWEFAGSYNYPETDADAWRRFEQQLAPAKRNTRLWTVFLSASAAAATIAAVYFSFFYRPETATRTGATAAMVYYNSAVGEQKTVTLPDDSRVTLNAGSGLWILPDYGATSRRVELKGEAFFDVKPGQQAFSVKVAEAEVQVLGTRFNVDAYGSKLSLQVAEGKVNLRGAGGSLLVPAGRGAWMVAGKPPVSTDGDSTAWAWKSGRLSFHNTPIPDVILEIERHYGVAVSYPENLAQKRYTGTFDKLSCDKVLDILSAAMGGTFALKQQD